MRNTTILVFLGLMQVILCVGHYFVYKVFVSAFGITGQPALNWTRVIFAVLAFSFLTASALNYKFYGPVGRLFYQGSAIWLGTLYWLIYASLLAMLVYILSRWFLALSAADIIVRVLMLAAVIISLYGVWNSNQTKVRTIDIHIPNLPQNWIGKKAILVADTHFGSYRNIGFANRISKLINSQHADIVLIPGDFFDGPPADFTQLAVPFANIHTPYGVYFAPGNHEEFTNSAPFFDALTKSGVKVLNNQMANVDGLQIIGVGFGSTSSAQKQKEIMQNLKVDKTKASILIKHQPSDIQAAADFNVSLQVSGHTHNGQVWPINLITKKIYGKFHAGLNSLGQTQVYTTSGAGTWGPPQRVGSNSEIVVLNFK